MRHDQIALPAEDWLQADNVSSTSVRDLRPRISYVDAHFSIWVYRIVLTDQQDIKPDQMLAP